MVHPLPVTEALQRILARCAPLAAETIALGDAAGRVLATEVVSDCELPPFDNSAMDGYAVHASDLAGANEFAPLALPVGCTIAAGQAQPPTLPPGRADRIMTGAPLPPGADAVVPFERTARNEAGEVLFICPVKPGANRRCKGTDLHRGVNVFRAGTPLGAAEIAVLAALGWARVPVVRQPRVVLISTGDELVPVEQQPGPGQIRNSSLVALPVQLAQAGARVVATHHVSDTVEAVEAVLAGPHDADLVLTIGGVSMGERDHVRPVFERLGQVDFWRVAVKPGKPLLFGTLGEALFFGLPGNPVSSMVTLDVFVRPALDALLGRRGGRVRVTGRWATDLVSDAKRTEYVRVRATLDESGAWLATPTGDQGSGVLTSMLGANAYALVPCGVERVAAGEPAQLELFENGWRA